MRRTPFVLGATAAGLAAVLSFHSRSGSLAASVGRGTTTTPTTRPSASPPTTAPGSSSVTTSPPTTAAGTATARTALGKAENYGYGTLRVQATVAGGKLTGLRVRTLHTAEPYSQQLAVQVIPMLAQQAKKVGGGKIYGVSGATYTSEAYAMSLQSALDKLHFP